MRETNFKLFTGAATTVQITSTAIDSGQFERASFQIFFSDSTPAGTFKIQASNDPCPYGNQYADFTPTNWVDIPNATATIVAGAAALILIPVCSFRSMRVILTSTNGSATGLATCEVDAKGV